jgi:hypothetical protein
MEAYTPVRRGTQPKADGLEAVQHNDSQRTTKGRQLLIPHPWHGEVRPSVKNKNEDSRYLSTV